MHFIAKTKIKVKAALLCTYDPQRAGSSISEQNTEPSKHEVHRCFAKCLFVSRKFQPSEKPDG